MTTKADYTSEEWEQLLEGPMSVTMYITIASPSVFGSIKEAMSVAKNIAKQSQESNTELLAALLADFQDKESAKLAQPEFESKDPASVKKEVIDELGAVVATLDAKATPEESTEVKAWLYQVGVDVANASKEGGFLGIGAVRVSDSEKAALSDIAGALGVDAE
jgi:hypothetical protein